MGAKHSIPDDDSLSLFLSEDSLPQQRDRSAAENDLAEFGSEEDAPVGVLRHYADGLLGESSSHRVVTWPMLAVGVVVLAIVGVERALLYTSLFPDRGSASRPSDTVATSAPASIPPPPDSAPSSNVAPIYAERPSSRPSARIDTEQQRMAALRPLDEPRALQQREDRIARTGAPTAALTPSSNIATRLPDRDRAKTAETIVRPASAPIPLPVADELTRLPGRTALTPLSMEGADVGSAPVSDAVSNTNAHVIADPDADANAVRQALRQYETAYENLDVVAAAKIWPSVDRRALTRAFATIKSQGLIFESCHIRVAASSATAKCRGVIQFVPKVGNTTPFSASQEWLFQMRKFEAEWRIEQVTGSQSSPRQTARTSGEY